MTDGAPIVDRHLLQVEDDEDDVFLIKHACKKLALGYSWHVVRDGSEALAYLSGEGRYANRQLFPFPKLILLDLNLPKLSGFELLKWIRADVQFNKLRVIAFSSSIRESDIVRAYEAGANGYFIKPSSADGFLQVMRSVRDFWLTGKTLPLEGNMVPYFKEQGPTD